MNKTNRTNKKAITLKTIDTELDLGISFASEQLSFRDFIVVGDQ